MKPLFFLILFASSAYGQWNVPSGQTVTILGSISPIDSIRIEQIGFLRGVASVICPPECTQAKIDSIFALGRTIGYTVGFRDGQNQRPVQVIFQTPDSLYYLR